MLAGGGMPGPTLETQSTAIGVADAGIENCTRLDTRSAATARSLTTAGTVALASGYAPGVR